MKLLSSLTWEFPKIRAPKNDTQVLVIFVKKAPPIFLNSHLVSQQSLGTEPDRPQQLPRVSILHWLGEVASANPMLLRLMFKFPVDLMDTDL